MKAIGFIVLTALFALGGYEVLSGVQPFPGYTGGSNRYSNYIAAKTNGVTWRELEIKNGVVKFYPTLVTNAPTQLDSVMIQKYSVTTTEDWLMIRCRMWVALAIGSALVASGVVFAYLLLFWLINRK